MNSKILVGFGALGVLAVLGAAGYGGWYAWDTGVIPGNKRAPTAQAMLPAVMKSAEFRARMLGRGSGACLGPEVGRLQPDLQGRPGIANRNLPGQHAVTFLVEGPMHTQDARERVLRQYGFLAKQGFYSEADVNLETDAGPRPAKEFRLTWNGFAALSQDYQPCFAMGRRQFTRIEKIERVPAETLGLELWDVSYHSEASGVPEWARGADAKALFPRYVEATAPKVEKVRLMRGKEAWLTEQEMQMQLQLSQLRAAGQDPNLIAAQMAQAMKLPEAPPDAATVKKLFDDYLASEQWQSRSQAVCVPIQLQRGGDDRGAMQFDRTSFSATWYDAPAATRQEYQRQQMLTQLHILSALEAAGLATVEKSGAGMVNNQPVPAGLKFTVRPEALESLGLAGGGCMPIGRFGKIDLVGHGDAGAGGMGVRLAARGELMLVQPWAQSLARWLPALKALIEEGVPFVGQLNFGPGYDRSSGAPTEAKWHVTGINPSYPQLQFAQVPAALQPYLPQTQASIKLVKAPAILPGLPGVSQPAPLIQIAPAPAPAAIPRAVPARPAPAPAPALQPKPRSEVPYPAGSADVHVISVYQGQLPGGAQRGFQQHPEGWIDVTVRKTANPALLFLNAYEPIEWRVKVDGGSVKRIIAIGYYDQRVTVTGQRGVEIHTEKSHPFFANARIEVRDTFPYEGRGNKALQAAEIINALFGKLPASFQGEYGRGKPFIVDEKSPPLVLPRPQSVATVGPGAVVLKSGWKDTAGSLSVQYGGAGAYTEAWASRAYTGGKVYFEATLQVEGGGPAQPHANVGVGELDSRGQLDHSFDALTPAIAHGEQNVYRNGDVFGVAIDYDAGVMYVRVNGQWITGEPGTGRGKRFRVGRERAAYLYATGGGRGGGERRGAVAWTANFGANHFSQPLPKGYASYDGGQR